MDVLAQLGIKKEEEGGYEQTLFYFMREFHINPFDEEYELIYENGKVARIIKKGISQPLFKALLEEMNKHYKKEAAEMKKSSRRR